MPANWVSAYDRWQDTKSKFQQLTGEKKPKPKGFVAQAFGHTGLTKALHGADESIESLEEAQFMPSGEKRDKALAEAIAQGDKILKTMEKECGGYAAFLKKEADDDKADEGQKSQRYRAIKMMKAELDQLVANYDQRLSSIKVFNDNALSKQQQLTKNVKKSMIAACKTAALAIKKVKADPTSGTYNDLFYTSDGPGRQINVQLAQAIKFELPVGTVDPEVAKGKLADWNAQGSAKSQISESATEEQVLALIKEFAAAVKFAIRYCDELP